MAKALGQTPEEAQAPNLDRLAAHLSGNVGLLFTNRDPDAVLSYLANFSPVDFARAGTVAPRGFTVPPGVVYSTGGDVDPTGDVPMGHTVEPELRRLGMPTSMVRGKVFLGSGNGDVAVESQEGYVVCKQGDVLDSRQTRLLKLFGICLATFQVKVLA
jgi:ribosomal protein L10